MSQFHIGHRVHLKSQPSARGTIVDAMDMGGYYQYKIDFDDSYPVWISGYNIEHIPHPEPEDYDPMIWHSCREHKVKVGFYEHGPLVKYACKVCNADLGAD